jgi:hypothetical protein
MPSILHMMTLTAALGAVLALAPADAGAAGRPGAQGCTGTALCVIGPAPTSPVLKPVAKDPCSGPLLCATVPTPPALLPPAKDPCKGPQQCVTIERPPAHHVRTPDPCLKGVDVCVLRRLRIGHEVPFYD